VSALAPVPQIAVSMTVYVIPPSHRPPGISRTPTWLGEACKGMCLEAALQVHTYLMLSCLPRCIHIQSRCSCISLRQRIIIAVCASVQQITIRGSRQRLQQAQQLSLCMSPLVMLAASRCVNAKYGPIVGPHLSPIQGLQSHGKYFLARRHTCKYDRNGVAMGAAVDIRET
jgi:hypothetical protein